MYTVYMYMYITCHIFWMMFLRTQNFVYMTVFFLKYMCIICFLLLPFFLPPVLIPAKIPHTDRLHIH